MSEPELNPEQVALVKQIAADLAAAYPLSSIEQAIEIIHRELMKALLDSHDADPD